MGQRGPTKHRGAQQKVLDYLVTNAGRPVTLDRLSADLGLPREVVSNAASMLVNRPDSGVARVLLGTYQFTPQAKKVPGEPEIGDMYELVGRTSDGTILVRSENGSIFRLAEL